MIKVAIIEKTRELANARVAEISKNLELNGYKSVIADDLNKVYVPEVIEFKVCMNPIDFMKKGVLFYSWALETRVSTTANYQFAKDHCRIIDFGRIILHLKNPTAL